MSNEPHEIWGKYGTLHDNSPPLIMTNHNNCSADDPRLSSKKGEETVKGVEKRVGKNGKISYRAKIRLKGYPVVSKTFKTITHAKKWKKQTEVQIEKGLYFTTYERSEHTLSEAIDKYIQQELPKKPKNADHTKRHLLWWKKKLGHCIVKNIKPAMIADLRDELLEGMVTETRKRSNSTVVRYLASLSHLMSIAEREWEWIPLNPVKKVTKPQEPPGRMRHLSQEEVERLLNVCQKERFRSLYVIVVLALSTGMRQGEILALTWDRVNLEKGFILLMETKNEEPRAVPLHGFTLELLKIKKEQDGSHGLLFPSVLDPNKPFYIRDVWNLAVKEANLSNFRFHDLRHSCASFLAMNSYSLLDIAKLLGHKDLKSTKRYSHLSHEHTKEMVKNINEQLFSEQVI